MARFAPPATVVDKPAYSAFAESSLANFLSNGGVDTLIVTGAETDVCVLSSVLDAVDIGFRVIVVEDGLCMEPPLETPDEHVEFLSQDQVDKNVTEMTCGPG